MEQTLPLSGINEQAEIIDFTLTHDPLQHAHNLFAPDIPENASLSIEETDGKLISRYIFRMTYKSGKSGRCINVVAKGDTLPTSHDDLYRYYYLQLFMTPTEVARELSRIYFIERRARQDAFLFTKDNIRVSDTGFEEDKLNFEDYA